MLDSTDVVIHVTTIVLYMTHVLYHSGWREFLMAVWAILRHSTNRPPIGAKKEKNHEFALL